MAESGALTSFSHRVFTAWDFGLCGDAHVRLRQRSILYELQVRLGMGVYKQVGRGRGQVRGRGPERGWGSETPEGSRKKQAGVGGVRGKGRGRKLPEGA